MGALSLLWILCIFVFGRLGEAAHPGPNDDVAIPPEHSFVLGTVNPTGITRKASSFLELPQGVWGIAESQATSTQFHSFRRELAFMTSASNRKIRTLHGAFAPPRPGSRDCGSWTGVGLFSDFPCSPTVYPWSSYEFISGRACGVHVVIGGLHLQGAVVYAPPTGPTHGNSTLATNELLQVISKELIHGSDGLRFVMGDFNRDIHQLATFDHWRLAGWQEVQQIALDRFSRQRVPTSKGSAYSDQIWVSPELGALLQDVQVLPEIFSEHDPLMATFALPTVAPVQWHWHMPARFPWERLQEPLQYDVPASLGSFHEDSSRAYAKWSSTTEAQICQSFTQEGIRLADSVRGRGQTLEARKRPMLLVPPRNGRHGDAMIRSTFLNRNTHRWFKQLRRLQAYAQRASSTSPSAQVQVDQLFTWKRILDAPGFRGGFRAWWPHRRIQLQGSPTDVPSLPPDALLASLFLLDFRANFRQLESWQLRRRSSVLQAQMHDHNKILYRQLQSRVQEAPECFTLHCSTLISAVSADGVVETTDTLSIPVSATWTLQGAPATLTEVDDTHFKIESDILPAVGQKLCGRHVIYDFTEMELALHHLWEPIWRKHVNLDPNHWQRALTFINGHLPTVEVPNFDWTYGKVKRIAQCYKKHTAPGPDGWTRDDLASLQDDSYNDISQMFQCLQEGADWPIQLVTGFTCPVPKTTTASAPSEHRPIILLPLLYRYWAAGASRHSLPHITTLAGQHIFGYIPHRRAGDLWWLVQNALEMTYVDSDCIVGFNLDLVRCFNHLPRQPILQCLKKLGMPPQLCDCWGRALSSLRRRFKIGASVGPPRGSTCGYPEGDPLSCLAMVGLTIMMDVYMTLFSGATIITSFVDNLQCIASSVGDLAHGILTLRVFLQMLDLVEDPNKSYAWASSYTHRRELRDQGFHVRLAAKDLGAQMSFSQLLRSRTSTDRLASVQELWSIIRRSPAPKWFKLLAIRTAILPKALHAVENKLCCHTTLKQLRSKSMLAMGYNRAGASPWARWSLMQPYDADPQFFQLWSVLRSALRMFTYFPHLQVAWQRFVAYGEPPSGQGPFHSLWDVLLLLQWSWDGDLVLDVGFLVVPFTNITQQTVGTILFVLS